MSRDSINTNKKAKQDLICSAFDAEDFIISPEQIDWVFVRELFVQRTTLNDDPRRAWACTAVFYDDTWVWLEIPHYNELLARNKAFRLSAEKDKPVGMYHDELPKCAQSGYVA